jgi:hypothetical protein
MQTGQVRDAEREEEGERDCTPILLHAAYHHIVCNDKKDDRCTAMPSMVPERILRSGGSSWTRLMKRT